MLPFLFDKNPDEDGDFPFDSIRLINDEGYRAEQYEVTTEDGYILTMFRIPGLLSEDESSLVSGPPVFFQHGIFDSSDGFLANKS